MNKILIFLSFALFAASMTSCKKDEVIEEEVKKPSFSCTLDWQNDFFDAFEVSSDSLLTSFDITMEEDFTVTEENFNEIEEFAFYGYEDEDLGQPFHLIGAGVTRGGDTTRIQFLLSGDLAEKTYPFITDQDLETEVIADGKSFGIYINFENTGGMAVTYASIFQEVDYGSSSITITEIDTEKKTISGSFNLEWKYKGENGLIPMLNVTDGKFVKLPFADI